MWWQWLWFALGLAALVGEGVALGNGTPDDTLSETIWRIVTKPFQDGKANALVWTGRIVILAFFAWLGPHLAFGWWTT